MLRTELNIKHATHEILEVFRIHALRLSSREFVCGVLEFAGKVCACNVAVPAGTHASFGFSEETTSADFLAVTELLAPEFLPGELTWRSLRVENLTVDKTFVTEGTKPHHLSYHLYGSDGSLLTWEGERSRFPVPLAPGAQLTVPLRIRAPDVAGEYELGIFHVQETVAWGQEPIYRTRITVSPNVVVPQCEVGHIGEFEYSKDWASSLDVLKSAVRGGERILEVACGMHPLSLAFEHQGGKRVATDLCYPELQLAKLYYRERLTDPESVSWLCADIEQLPLREGAFDLIVICAALHHFPDPIDALSRLKKHLAPGGRFVIVREPCGTNPGDVNYLEQLMLGFNEQQFELAEYACIFDRAGLAIERMQLDFGGSLKAVLHASGASR
ncbi:MAG: class I SAM-dependent methyltransferase [Hyphomicrobiaceae bacterium]